VPQKDSGLASGLLNTSQQIGGALGLAILTGISTAATTKYMTAANGDQSAAPAAMVAGFQDAFIAAAWFVVGASVIAFIGLKQHKMSKDEIAHEAESEAEGFPVVPGV
jgi:hypothetical protein